MNFKQLFANPGMGQLWLSLGLVENSFKSPKLFPKVAFAGTPLALHGVGSAGFP